MTLNYWIIPGLRYKDINPDTLKGETSHEKIMDIIRKAGTIRINNYYVTVEQLLSNSRKSEVVFLRSVIMYLASKMFTLVAIANVLNKDHTTVIHNRDKINNLIDLYPEYKELISKIQLVCIQYLNVSDPTNLNVNLKVCKS